MSILHGKNKWVNLRKVMIEIWPREWHHNVINLMDDMAEKHNGMSGQVVKELN